MVQIVLEGNLETITSNRNATLGTVAPRLLLLLLCSTGDDNS